jgi:hypothetical protein
MAAWKRPVAAGVAAFASTTTSVGVFSAGNAARRWSIACTAGMARESESLPGSETFIPSAGNASASSTAALASAEISGRRMTASTIRVQPPRSRLKRPANGIRPLSTRSPSADSAAGSTDSEPSTETATTRIAPVASETNVGEPARYMPAIAIITVRPETNTARPEVAAAASRAASGDLPERRSSRSRFK